MKKLSVCAMLSLAVLTCLLMPHGTASAEDTVVIRLMNDPDTMNTNLVTNPNRTDPPRSMVVEALVDIGFDDSNRIMPRLAESWEVDKDGMGVTLRIRKNVRFHNGDLLTADDVVYSLAVLTKGGMDAMRYPWVDWENVSKVDDHTVHVPLKEENITVMQNLTGIGIYNKKYVEANKNKQTVFLEDTVGTGPYRLAEWVTDDYVRVVRNDDYWGDKARIPNVIFRVINEKSVALMEVMTGGIDFMWDVEFKDAENVRKNPSGNLKVLQMKDATIAYLGFNLAGKNFTDINVRRAIATAVDRDAIVQGTYENSGHVPYSIFGELGEGLVTWTRDTWPTRYDPEKAKKLLADAGKLNNLDLTILADSNDYYRRGFAEQVAHMLEAIGVKMTIKLVDPASMQGTLQNQTIPYDLYVRRYNGVGTPGYFAQHIMSNIGLVNHQDKAEGYPALHAMILEVLRTWDDGKRLAIWKDLQNRFFTEWLYWYPVQHVDNYVICNKRLQNVKNAYFSYNIDEWYYGDE